MLKKLITISLTALVSLQAATTYNKSLSDGNDDLNYWSDTTDTNLNNHTLVGATEVFTIGSRENIPNIPTSSIKVTTNKLCSDDRKGLVSCSKSDYLEPRYTDDGLATSGEINLRTWYKATTPKSVNGVVDNPCPSLSNVGSVVNWAANFPSLRCERTITTYTPKVNSTIYTNKVSSDIFANKLSSTTSTSSVVYANKISGSSSYAATSDFVLLGSVSRTATGDNGANSGTIPIYGDFGMYIYPSQTPSKKTVRIRTSTNPSIISVSRNPGTVSTIYNGYKLVLSITAIASRSVSGSAQVYGNKYTCPSGGTLSGSTCTTTSSTCPSGYVDNGSNCKKTVAGSATTYYCPSGYSDNGSNCKKTIQICPDASWTSATATTCSKVIQVCPDSSWTNNGSNCRKNVPEYKLFSTF